MPAHAAPGPRLLPVAPAPRVDPRRGLIPTEIAVLVGVGLASLAAVFGGLPDPPPRTAFAPVRLYPASNSVKRQCRLAQARASVPVLCPRRLPNASLRQWRTSGGTPPPRLTVQRADYLDRGGRTILLTFAYGAPWEPDSGPDWRQHLWRNRPCCFLHFEAITRVSGRPLPTADGRPAILGGRHGVYLPALGNAPQCGTGDRSAFWCNHDVFAWRERGVQYAATLHSFGASATRLLLGRLVAELAPVR